MTPRQLHRKISPFLLPLLAVSALTGMIYRVGRNWFGMSSETGLVVRSIHDGKYLGEFLSSIYVLVTGAGLLLLIGTGLALMRRRSRRRGAEGSRSRHFHRIVALVLALPLAVTAATGVAFKLTQSWFGWSKEEAQWLMDVHQGTLFFGRDHRVYYALFVGLGLLALVATGAKLLGWFRKRA